MAGTYVIGDPQAPFDKLCEVLDRHGALAGDRLAPDVVLVSIGDHFDYDLHDPETAGREGVRTLRWLASHDPAQVTLLLGNHDISRVMELAQLTDEEFTAARLLARSIDATAQAAGRGAAEARERTEFRRQYPALPRAGVIGRDFASFTTAQRALVVELLLAGRFRLAITGALEARPEVLITHAGVTRREIGLLGVPAVPGAIAAALEATLRAAIELVRADWQRGVITPLSLEPLHVAGGAGEEGGGLLYHRPTHPTKAVRDPARPRRFDPRTLPSGVTQIVGHTGHAKCVEELGPWATDAARARAHGGLRTLRVRGELGHYNLGVAAGAPGADTAEVIFIDGELRRVPATEVALLPLVGLGP